MYQNKKYEEKMLDSTTTKTETITVNNLLNRILNSWEMLSEIIKTK